MKKAQKDLNDFSGKSKAAGHATVNSTQAASAALRVMQGDMTNNIRAVERFVGSIPGVGAALKIAFPLVGGIAFASLIVDMGMKVRTFIKTVGEMPNTIKKGFESLSLS